MNSEVARVLEQIRTEYEAAERGLYESASGMAKHAFITARLEHMSHLCADLHTLAGDEAMVLVAQELDNLPIPVYQNGAGSQK